METGLITFAVMVVLIAAVLLLWPLLLRYFVRDYYKQHYAPVQLEETSPANMPEEHHLMHVPWVISPWQLCQSTSLQIISASHGIDYPRSNFDFLMAFTYGASSLPGTGFTPLGTDPEIGLITAAPYLGLKRVYGVTDQPEVFLSALRSYLSKGYPIRLALNEGRLYQQSEFLAHSVVVVGYDQKGFYYYETVGLPPSPVEPGEHAPGKKGLYVTTPVLLEAVEQMSRQLRYPWRYALTIFEPAPLEEDLRPVWLLTGRASADEIKYGPKMGARVIEDVASKIERDGTRFDLATVRNGVELAAQVRADNAAFLRMNFSLHADLLEAAGLFEQASRSYRLVMEDIEDGIADAAEGKRVASRLFDAAAAERKAGEIFLKRGNAQI